MSKRDLFKGISVHCGSSYRPGPSAPRTPGCRLSRRTYVPRRSASTTFWTQNFPHGINVPSLFHYVPNVPAVPPEPSVIPVPVVPQVTQTTDLGAMKREKKQRYLDNLMDKAGELSLRFSILDAQGDWTAEEGRYKKSELCREHDLDPRDLRKLDSLTPNLVPLILTRRTCILISMLHIRALIKPDRVIVFDIPGNVENEVQRRFKRHLERHIRAGLKSNLDEHEEESMPYEHRALESILVATSNALEEEMAFSRQLVQRLLADLEDDINRDNLKRLLHYSRRMVGYQSRARYVKRAVDEVLESDEDLSAMYLTSRARGRPRALHDHEQLELLLESFVKQVEEIVSEVDTTVANMNSTQEIAELMLDSGRNALLALDIKVSIATLGVGTGAMLAGLFGMNLTTDLEHHPQAFLIVSSTASIIAIIMIVYGMRVLRRVRRVALSGNKSPSLGRLVSSQIYSSSIASLAQAGDRLSLRDKSVRETGDNLAAVAVRRKAAFWDRIFRKRFRPRVPKGAEPVWINKQADTARTRDAWRTQEHEMQERARSLHGFRTSGGKETMALEKAWQDGADRWDPDWESQALRWRAKARWG